jgi:hypothetical protein
MKIVKNKNTQENERFWSHVERVAQEVNSWPKWMANSDKEQPENEGAAENNEEPVQDSPHE